MMDSGGGSCAGGDDGDDDDDHCNENDADGDDTLPSNTCYAMNCCLNIKTAFGNHYGKNRAR